MFFDPLYLLLALPGMLLAILAQIFVKSTFARYKQVRSSRGMTGAQAAHQMLSFAGVHDCRIEQVQGFLTDHYDPSCKTLRLSPEVYQGTNLSAIGVACHEAGHAIQHAEAYTWLSLRSTLVPVANFGSSFSYILFIAGYLFSAPFLINLGLILFSLAVLFSIVTLPVEWDASSRAKRLMVTSGVITSNEASQAGSVLNAAFMTYVAAAVQALGTLHYYFQRSRRR
ncbi:MAG: zinc metallopeptidase [Victivallales bacterium]|nr:zinc metallopeptidase [Victivallales bacterium]